MVLFLLLLFFLSILIWELKWQVTTERNYVKVNFFIYLNLIESTRFIFIQIVFPSSLSVTKRFNLLHLIRFMSVIILLYFHHLDSMDSMDNILFLFL